MTVYQRQDGEIETAVRVVCRAYGERLVTTVYVGDKEIQFKTER